MTILQKVFVRMSRMKTRTINSILIILSLLTPHSLSWARSEKNVLPAPVELNENVDTHVTDLKKIKFTKKVKNKMVTLAEAELTQSPGKMKVVFDSERLTPGQYKIVIATACNSAEKQNWLVGKFKTQSGFISTEFVIDEKDIKMDLSNPDESHVLVIKKEERKGSTSISCAGILKTPPVVEQVAAEGL